MSQEQKKHPFAYLLLIPLAAVLDVGLLLLGAYLDTQLFSQATGQGHGFPVCILLAAAIAAILTIILVITAIVRMGKALRERR